jgi:endonuclease YncB( thermonuclease family)
MNLRSHLFIVLGFYSLASWGLMVKYNIFIFHWFDLVYLAFMVLITDFDTLFGSLHRRATHNVFVLLLQIFFSIWFFDDLIKILFIIDALLLNWLLDILEGSILFVWPIKDLHLTANTQIPKLVENLFSTLFLAILILLFSFGALPTPLTTDSFTQEVKSLSSSLLVKQDILVLDGDTILIKSTGERIRIYGIDTPEITGHEQKEHTMKLFNLHDKQCLTYWGDEAKKELEKRIKQAHNISIVRIEKGAYGRTIGKLLIDGQDWSIIATKEGLAMPYLWSGKTTEEIKKAYQEARKEKKGLWSCD